MKLCDGKRGVNMTYAMTLDNSWAIMNEEEMYDVNGGWDMYISHSKIKGILGDVITNYGPINAAMIAGGSTTLFAMVWASMKTYSGLVALGAIPVWGQIAVAAIGLISLAVVGTLLGAYLAGKGIKIWANVDFSWFSVSVDVGVGYR